MRYDKGVNIAQSNAAEPYRKSIRGDHHNAALLYKNIHYSVWQANLRFFTPANKIPERSHPDRNKMYNPKKNRIE